MTSKSTTLSDVLQLDRDATPLQIQTILNLSCQVFGTPSIDSAESRFASLSEWRSRLRDPKSLIFYICEPKSRPVAFLFLHPKLLMNKDHLHIWLAGVSEQYRQLGLWRNLLDAAFIHARNLDMPLSIRTNQYKFPAMYAFLSGSFKWQECERDDSGSITYVLAKQSLVTVLILRFIYFAAMRVEARPCFLINVKSREKSGSLYLILQACAYHLPYSHMTAKFAGYFV